MGKNFAETTRGLISGIVYKDANGNGIKDSLEVGLAGWVVFLDTNNNGKLDAGELSFTTGSDGKFSFVVPAGTYHLRKVLKSGFKRTTPSAGVYNITLAGGQSAIREEFRGSLILLTYGSDQFAWTLAIALAACGFASELGQLTREAASGGGTGRSTSPCHPLKSGRCARHLGRTT